MGTDTDVQLRRQGNAIASWALAISIIAAMTGIAAFATPLVARSRSELAHRKALVAGLSATTRPEFMAALSHVSDESAADTYLINLDDWWDAAFAASGKAKWEEFRPIGGSAAATREGYRVCLPDLVLSEQCMVLSDFVHDPSTGLITRFSVDHVPVDRLSWRGQSDDDHLSAEDGLKIFAAQRGTVMTSDLSMKCVSFLVSSETDDRRRPTTYFDRATFEFLDRGERETQGYTRWPARLSYLESTWTVACVPNGGGFVRIVQQRARDDRRAKASGWLRI